MLSNRFAVLSGIYEVLVEVALLSTNNAQRYRVHVYQVCETVAFVGCQHSIFLHHMTVKKSGCGVK
jgi:hypothetical protein